MTAATLPTARRTTVLLVDDERTNLQVLSALLKNDYEVLSASDGERALALAAQHRPDLVLLDVLMPGMDGHEVCRRLRGNTDCADTAVIFVTALGEAHDEAFGLDLGAVDYIAKPFNPAVVRARVRTHARLKRQNDLLAELVMLDALTDIPNRRGWEQSCEREWARCRRAHQWVALAMVDVDHFKGYNDHHGHGAGDLCLTQVAQALQSCLRRGGDLIARYGGEEFAVLLPATCESDALRQAQRMGEAVQALRIAHGHSSASPWVSVSIGVACVRASVHTSIGALTERADAALYAAKAAGRNRVMAAPPDLA
ncbi:MAG: diguanylate cyclase domain-containing protein [Rhodoferax sp.]